MNTSRTATRKPATEAFAVVAIPAKRRKENPYARHAAFLAEHVGTEAIQFEDEKPGYALGKVRAAMAEVNSDLSVRAQIEGTTLTLWAVTRRPRKVTKAAAK